MASLTEGLQYLLLLVFLIGILDVNQIVGNNNFKGLQNYRNNIVKMWLGDGNVGVYTDHFKLAWTMNGASQINYTEYHVTGQLANSLSSIMSGVSYGGQINQCYDQCLANEKCYVMYWFNAGADCQRLTSNGNYPTPTLPLSIAPQLVRFVQRKYTDPNNNAGPWVTFMHFIYLRLNPMVTYNFSFVEPYNSASTTNWRSIVATEADVEDSYFQYWCKAATFITEPIICRVVTNFTYSPTGVITAPNKVRWMDDSSSALVFSTNDILGNGYATHVRKFSFTAAGPHRVRIKAFKDNKAGENIFYDTTHTIADNSYELFLENHFDFLLTEETGVMYNFTICLSAMAPETVFVYPNDGSNLNIRLTEVDSTSKPSWIHNFDHQVSSNSTPATDVNITDITNKEYFLFSSFITTVKVYKSLKLYAATPGEIQINWATFKSGCTEDVHNCFARLSASTKVSSDELNYYYSLRVTLTAGYNFVNLTDSSGVPITSVAKTILTWTSLGGMLGVKWLSSSTPPVYWLPSDLIMETNNNAYTYRSLATYNTTVSRFPTERAAFLVDLEIERLMNSYCYKLNHTYAESILDRGTSFPMVAYVESQRADPTKHTTIVTATFALIKITCPATVETNTQFRCQIRMFKAPRNRYNYWSQFNYTVVFGTTPQQVYNRISSRGYPANYLRNVDQTINTPGTFTVTAYEADWAVQASTTITVTQKALIQFACPTSVQAFDDFKCNITMVADPPAGETNHNVTVTYGANTVTPVHIAAVFPKGSGRNTNKHQVTSSIEEVGVYTVSAYLHYVNQNVSVTVNITRVIGFSFGQTKKVISAIFDNPNNTGQDPIASLSDANPQLLLDILSLPGQDMGGCLSNCSNKGKCTMNDQNKFVCQCQTYYRGSMCEIDIRGCTPKPCQNNGTCTEVIIPGQEDQGFTCNCSSPVFFGVRCEQKVNVCWNKTCNYNGKCFDNATIPTCKCFKYFSGEDCDVKSEELKAMKQTAAIASVLAITMVTGFYISIFVGDYFSLVHASVVALFA